MLPIVNALRRGEGYPQAFEEKAIHRRSKRQNHHFPDGGHGAARQPVPQGTAQEPRPWDGPGRQIETGARDWFEWLRRANPTLFAHWQLCHGNGRTSGAV